MLISYNWLSQYLPDQISPEKLSDILTAIGLEVESLHPYSTITADLSGLVTGEVLTVEKHPNADKLNITTVDTGNAGVKTIVCGAKNVAVGQKVIVALPGTTIHPTKGEPFTIKLAKIRGQESEGMICAEDEIGLGEGHEGIMVLPAGTPAGKPVNELFPQYNDHIYEIGLTPNRMDAMSHRGAARDVMAWLQTHEGTDVQADRCKSEEPETTGENPFSVAIEEGAACSRYTGAYLTGIKVKESPEWLQNYLKAIGVKSINNVVDITNYILHDTGQPLHAFDADKIGSKNILVKNAQAGSKFTTLDGKERTLAAEDLLITDGSEALCLAGVYGGANSGVTAETKNIFLESAHFLPGGIRKTSLRHGLRTDAATRFEKGVDVSQTKNVLLQAVNLLREYAGAKLQGDLIDHYPVEKPRTVVEIDEQYIRKLSGKEYSSEKIRNILLALHFEILKENSGRLTLAVPYSKADISIPADVVEEIMRIDGLDNIPIPEVISISPGADNKAAEASLKDRALNILMGSGFREIITNSITDSKYFAEETLQHTVKMINNLSADLDVMRPAMLQSGLEVIAYNVNRKNPDLQLFEFGKVYSADGLNFTEAKRLAIWSAGRSVLAGWQQKETKSDFYGLKGLLEKLFHGIGLQVQEKITGEELSFVAEDKILAKLTAVQNVILAKFGIRDEVFFADIDWDAVVKLASQRSFTYREISKYPVVERDLAIVVDKSTAYSKVRKTISGLNIAELQHTGIFDVFESDKLGANKKSVALNFKFLNNERTLTDAETERFMQTIATALQNGLQAEIRK